MHLGLVTVVVSEYDPAISFFVDGLGFELVEDSPALTNDGRPKCIRYPVGAVRQAVCPGEFGLTADVHRHNTGEPVLISNRVNHL